MNQIITERLMRLNTVWKIDNPTDTDTARASPVSCVGLPCPSTSLIQMMSFTNGKKRITVQMVPKKLKRKCPRAAFLAA